MRTRHAGAILVLVLSLGSAGCGLAALTSIPKPPTQTTSAPASPAIIQTPLASLDRNAFDTLLTVQTALEALSANITQFPQYKPQLNHVIDLYNAAQASYKVFHASGAAGQPADLSYALANLTAAMGDIVRLTHPGGSN